MNTTSALEKRTAVALSSDITAANLSSLIAKTETAIAAADQAAEAEREKPDSSWAAIGPDRATAAPGGRHPDAGPPALDQPPGPQ
jgi:hypothetical protein